MNGSVLNGSVMNGSVMNRSVLKGNRNKHIGLYLFVFIIFHCPNFYTAPHAAPLSRHPGLTSFPADYICTLSVTLLTHVLKNSFGMILKVFLTKQEKIMAWPE